MVRLNLFVFLLVACSVDDTLELSAQGVASPGCLVTECGTDRWVQLSDGELTLALRFAPGEALVGETLPALQARLLGGDLEARDALTLPEGVRVCGSSGSPDVTLIDLEGGALSGTVRDTLETCTLQGDILEPYGSQDVEVTFAMTLCADC